MAIDQDVRDAACNLAKVIQDAVAAGYRVTWPGRHEDLDRIAVSSSAQVAEHAREVAPVSAPVATLKAPAAPAKTPAPRTDAAERQKPD